MTDGQVPEKTKDNIKFKDLPHNLVSNKRVLQKESPIGVQECTQTKWVTDGKVFEQEEREKLCQMRDCIIGKLLVVVFFTIKQQMKRKHDPFILKML